MRKLIMLMSIVLLVVGLTAPVLVQAQTQENGLLAMLQVVPATPDVLGSEIGYLDAWAMVAAREGAAQITSLEDWNTADPASDEMGLFMAALLGFSAGNMDILLTIRNADDMVQLTGVDPFAIERHLTFGKPPAFGSILTGEFDPAAIEMAFAARGYEAAKDGESLLLCYEGDCAEHRFELNLRDRDPANPFGGKLGRIEPLFVTPNLIISSPDDRVVAASMGLYKQVANVGSVAADYPDYTAIATALGGEYTLLQGYILPASYTSLLDPVMLGRVTEEQREALLEKLRTETQAAPLPVYNLVGIGYVANEDERAVLIALSYDNEADAQIAAESLPLRVENYISAAVQRPLLELIEEREGSLAGASVIAVGDKYVTVLKVEAPTETTEKIDGRFTASGILFRLFYNAVIQRDMQWLTTTLPE